MNKIHSGQIAIVDDDPLVRDGLRDCMESAGYSVEAYGSAEEFLAAIPLRPPLCLIVDLELPGISGLEMQGRLRAMGSRVPVVFVTAHGSDLNRELALRDGAAALLPKPIRRAELLKTVQAAMER
ncbi:response regulator transcription factor [Paludibaculum fermentans]|uniref:response regulator transcription factor n=1 Tax=Paludibaculum fermentans TaxID=1473598 RepID=UPI003EBFA0FB